MKTGLEIFDEQGRIIYDSSVNTTTYLGSGQTNGISGSLQNDKLNGKKFWVVITSREIPSNKYKGWVAPVFSCSGNTLSWEYPGNNLGEAKNNGFIYGVY